MRRHLTPTLAIISILSFTPVHGNEFAGVARAVDGDTLVVGEQSLRLSGIDAWELGQTCPDEDGATFPCGREALVYVRSLVDGMVVYCSAYTHPTRGTPLTTCYRDGRDVAEELVRNGWAMAQGVNAPRYAGMEKAARMSRRGGWRGLPSHPPLTPEAWKNQR